MNFIFFASFFIHVEIHAALSKPVVQQLSNGLTLAIFEDHKLPLVDFVMLLPYGSVHDPIRKSGTAQLMIEMLDRGSDGLSAKQFAQLVEDRGATTYSSLDSDSITLGMHGLSSDRDSLFELFLKWALKPSWNPEEFQKEKTKILDRWSHLDDQTSLLAMLGFQRRVSNGTRYARGTMLSDIELKTVSLSDVVGYYQAYFRPSNAVLMIVGDVKPVEWQTKAAQLMTAWTGTSQKPTFLNFSNPRLEADSEVVIAIDKPDAPHADIRLGVPAPGFLSSEHYDLMVSNSIFGDTFGSWLNTKIRDQSGFVYSIGSSFSHSIGFSTWGVSTSTHPDQIGVVLRSIFRLYQDFQSAKFSEFEISFAKSYLAGSFAVNNSTLSQVASRWLAGRLFQLPDDYLEKFVERIQKVNLSSVQRATRLHFQKKHAQVVVSCDRAKCEKSLVSSGFKRLKWLKASDLK